MTSDWPRFGSYSAASWTIFRDIVELTRNWVWPTELETLYSSVVCPQFRVMFDPGVFRVYDIRTEKFLVLKTVQSFYSLLLCILSFETISIKLTVQCEHRHIVTVLKPMITTINKRQASSTSRQQASASWRIMEEEERCKHRKCKWHNIASRMTMYCNSHWMTFELTKCFQRVGIFRNHSEWCLYITSWRGRRKKLKLNLPPLLQDLHTECKRSTRTL